MTRLHFPRSCVSTSYRKLCKLSTGQFQWKVLDNLVPTKKERGSIISLLFCKNTFWTCSKDKRSTILTLLVASTSSMASYHRCLPTTLGRGTEVTLNDGMGEQRKWSPQPRAFAGTHPKAIVDMALSLNHCGACFDQFLHELHHHQSAGTGPKLLHYFTAS